MIQHKIPLMLCALLSINITACNSVGNVVPQKGPSMEQVYDDMGHTNARGQSTKNSANASDNKDGIENTNPYESNLKQIRRVVHPVDAYPTLLRNQVLDNATWKSFHKVPNPTLTLFVYPHLAGNDELPVPGYSTAFNAYEREHYTIE